MNLVHLHVHSDVSLKDGLGPVANLIAHAKELGFEAMGLTDHGSLANAVAFTIECERQGIKPLLGVEGYVVVDKTIGHLTLYANGNEGWENLVRLNNLGHASEFREPAFTWEQLLGHADGLVCLTGCPASPLNSLPFEQALELGQQLKMTFKERLFAEVTFVGDMATWQRPVQLANALKLPIVVTNDVHFAEKSDAPIHTI
jgi:DNA polymerase-3 subunit alpha